MQTAQKLQKRVQIDENNSRVLACVYGTLRQGYGNWSRILKDNSTLLGTYQSDPQFTMYNTGGFPIVIDQGDTAIEYEVYEITNRETVERMHRLEGCTGIPDHEQNWYDIQPIETPHGRAYMYIMHEEQNLPVIESGNWKNA